MSQCNCPIPPGGKVVCMSHQMAVCTVVGGEAVHYCYDPIAEYVGGKPEAVVNWALGKLRGEYRSSNQSVTRYDLDFLNGNKGDNLTFDLPPAVRDAIQDMRSDMNSGLELTV